MAQSTTNAVLRPKWVQITGSCRCLMAAFVHISQANTLAQKYYAQAQPGFVTQDRYDYNCQQKKTMPIRCQYTS